MKLLLRMQHADRSDESDALTYEGIEECEDIPKEVKVIDEVQNGDQCGFKVLANDMLESMTSPAIKFVNRWLLMNSKDSSTLLEVQTKRNLFQVQEKFYFILRMFKTRG